jgi:sulfoxide reductase heme-binding subunit YedZ
MKSLLIREQVVIFIAIVLASYFASLLIWIAFTPAPLANILGFLALLSYSATILPSITRIVFPATKQSRQIVWLLKYRRYIGVAAFSFGLNHGVLIIIQRRLDLMALETYIHYFQGCTILVIFTLLAITSNDQAVKLLKKNWKRLHQLTYIAIFLLPWHILDKMSGHWSKLTPLAVMVLSAVAILFARKCWLEKATTRSKAKINLKKAQSMLKP